MVLSLSDLPSLVTLRLSSSNFQNMGRVILEGMRLIWFIIIRCGITSKYWNLFFFSIPIYSFSSGQQLISLSSFIFRCILSCSIHIFQKYICPDNRTDYWFEFNSSISWGYDLSRLFSTWFICSHIQSLSILSSQIPHCWGWLFWFIDCVCGWWIEWVDFSSYRNEFIHKKQTFSCWTK